MNHILFNKIAYDRVADIFSSTREYLWDDFKGLEKYVSSGDNVLDVGCGNGRLYDLFDILKSKVISHKSKVKKHNNKLQNKKSIEYVGIDQSEELIKIAKKKYPDAAFVVGEMTELPFEDNSFDAVYCMAVFCHLPPEYHEKALLEMKRVLKPGGYLVMTNWNAFNDWVQNKVNVGKYTTEDQKNFIVPWRNGPGDVLAERYYYGFDLEELRKLYEQSGFEIVEHYFAKKGKRAPVELGENIVSVLKLSK